MARSTSQHWYAALGIKHPFTIPSGIVTTLPSVIARIARSIPEIGFLTTKTISVQSREGYREPVLHEYYPGCFVNAVGLANPGAESFLSSMREFLPLYGSKPLLVSIMGCDAEEFLQCASILDPIADKFLVISALILLVDMVRLSAWVAIVIIVREFVVTALRVVALSKNIVIPAETGGKLKTASQMTAIILLLLPGGIGDLDFYDVGLVLMYIALILALVSGVKYTISFWRQMQ